MLNDQNVVITPAFYSDRDLAERLRISPSTIRVQRMRRRKGLPHYLTLDPRYIGGAVRYVASEVEAWIVSISTIAA